MEPPRVAGSAASPRVSGTARESLRRVSDAQLDDAFTASGYEPEIRARRFIKKIREKIQEGVALEAKAGARR